MTTTELRALLERAKMTQKEGAKLCGVTLRQFQNWVSGWSQIPILAESALIVAEQERAYIAFEREIGTQTPADRREMLEFIAAEQRRRIESLERDLSEERTALAETMASMKL